MKTKNSPTLLSGCSAIREQPQELSEGDLDLIRVENLHKHFGGFRAVDGASLEIAKGSITGLIGPNGAGKTTLFNVIAGVHEPTDGTVTLDGEDITGLPPHELFHKGVLRTFQIAHEYGSISCRESLMMVPAGQSGEVLWNTWFGRKRIADEERALRAKADEVMEFLTIEHLADHKAGQVSGGQKKLLELGRTMMVDAKIVFLDEVGAGVNRTLLNTIGDAIIRLNKERGYTFVVISTIWISSAAFAIRLFVWPKAKFSPKARWTRSKPTNRLSRHISAQA